MSGHPGVIEAAQALLDGLPVWPGPPYMDADETDRLILRAVGHARDGLIARAMSDEGGA